MPDATVAFVTPDYTPRWMRWWVLSPLARIVIFAALLVISSGLVMTSLSLLGWYAETASPLQQSLARFGSRALPALLAYLLLVNLIEQRKPRELAPRKLLPDGLVGLLAGALLFSAIVGILYLLGSYHVDGINSHEAWLPALLVTGLGAGIGEEIIFRGVLFRIIEEGLGSWIALIVSALFFGAAHLFNPAATLWSSAAIAIEAGVLFGLLYHVTRSLYVCIGVHAAWNFMQGTVYGIPVSGTPAHGWLMSRRSGPNWLGGGRFGAEASVVALALCLLCSAALLLWIMRHKTHVPWRRWRTTSPESTPDLPSGSTAG